MAEYGEWNRKGATLSDITAQAEYGVSRDFIINGIECGTLEYREGSIWGNPYLRVLRRQLEAFIAQQRGKGYLSSAKDQAELRRLKKEIASLKKTFCSPPPCAECCLSGTARQTRSSQERTDGTLLECVTEVARARVDGRAAA
jgi:hypothetical protein